MIDVQRLRILRTVAEHGSFNQAAAALRLTPSAVSQHVAVLERSLGAQVVERSTRGVTLTQAGRIMVGAAESVAAELAHAKRQVDRLGTGRTQFTLATFTSGGRLLLPGALPRMTVAHPDMVVHVREAEPEDSLPLVRQGAVDVALAYHFDGPLPVRPGRTSDVEWTLLMKDPLHVVLPEAHPLADRQALDIAELSDEPWVFGCLKTQAYLCRYAERAGFSPEVRGATTDLLLRLLARRGGRGCLADPLHHTGPGIAGSAGRSDQSAGPDPTHRRCCAAPPRPLLNSDPDPGPSGTGGSGRREMTSRVKRTSKP